MPNTPLYLYCFHRLLQAIPLLLCVIVVNFVIIHSAPGDPVYALIGDFPAPPEYVAQMRHEFGLDQPQWKQLVVYIGNVLQGDFGYSYAQKQPVLSLIADRMVSTAVLTGTAMVIAVISGVALGVLSSIRPYSWLDMLATGISLVGYSLPVFWLGQVLIVVFAVNLGWMPSGGTGSLRSNAEGFDAVLEYAKYLTLPVLALLWRYLAVNTRITRASMMEAMSRDYIRTARAKGLDGRTVILRHGLRNALLPIITIVGYNLGFLLAGSALVESVFSWPGIGLLLYKSITLRDYPVILGIFVVTATMVILANLLTDIVIAILDPRVRY